MLHSAHRPFPLFCHEINRRCQQRNGRRTTYSTGGLAGPAGPPPETETDGRVPRTVAVWRSAGRRRRERGGATSLTNNDDVHTEYACSCQDTEKDRIFRCMHTFRFRQPWVASNLASAGASPSGLGLELQHKALATATTPACTHKGPMQSSAVLFCFFLYKYFPLKKRKAHIYTIQISKGSASGPIQNANKSFPILFRWP
jgi:hypothetical protein